MICARDHIGKVGEQESGLLLQGLLPLSCAHPPPGPASPHLASHFELFPASQHLPEERAEGERGREKAECVFPPRSFHGYGPGSAVWDVL